MSIVITLLHVVACFVLIVVVLLQQGKGADVGAVFGGSSQTIFGSTGAGNLLTRLTTWTAVIFMVTSLFLTWSSTHHLTTSVADSITDEPAPIAAPLTSGDTAAPADENGGAAPASAPAAEEGAAGGAPAAPAANAAAPAGDSGAAVAPANGAATAPAAESAAPAAAPAPAAAAAAAAAPSAATKAAENKSASASGSVDAPKAAKPAKPKHP